MKLILIGSTCIVFGLAMVATSGIMMMDKVYSLQRQVRILQDLQDADEIHMRFLDSDNTKLREDIANLRTDTDIMRYREGR